jgi:hypothetical protein
MKKQTKFTATLFVAFLLLAFIPAPGGSFAAPPKDAQGKDKDNVVYVCACLGTKSCACMTEAKTEGPCACGTSGGPPLKAVPKDSSWAKENRDALAK